MLVHLQRIRLTQNRLEAQETMWTSLLPSKSASKKTPVPPSMDTSINASLLSTSQQSLLSLLDPLLLASASKPEANTESTQSAAFSSTSIASRVNHLASNLEPTIDQLADGVHHLSQFNQHASRVADRIKGVWARRLERRDEEARNEAGASEFGARDVLRALSGKLNE
jgi:kinetochore protein Mis13/DSN1